MLPVEADGGGGEKMARKITKGEVIADIRRVAKIIRHAPTSPEYEKHGNFTFTTAIRRVAGTWPEVIAECGLLYKEKKGRWRVPSNDELEKDIRRVTTSLGKPPTSLQYKEHGQFNRATLHKRAGSKNWPNVLVFFLKIDIEEARRYGRNGSRGYKKTSEALDELRDLAQRLGHTPAVTEAIAHGLDTRRLRERVGGGWRDVLVAAGLSLSARPRSVVIRSMSNDDLINDVVRVARLLGRPPSMSEQMKLGKVSPHTLYGRFGHWTTVQHIVQERTQGKPSVKELSHVDDPIRDFLQSESTEAIKDFFKRRNQS